MRIIGQREPDLDPPDSYDEEITDIVDWREEERNIAEWKEERYGKGTV
jgi:hypothetical protein